MSTTSTARALALLLPLIGWFPLATTASAQTSATGGIVGRVYNPSTQEYVRNAEVRLAGTPQMTTSESDGSFQFTGVAAGVATLSVSHAGYTTVVATFTVTAGQTAMREISLTSTLAGKPLEGEAVKLAEFVVSSEREGNAKAIMEQRRNLNISTSVASDVYGDLTDGNVGEFLKFLPGLDIEYIQSEARGVRLGGMDSQYVGFTVDGVKLASAEGDPNFGGGLTRVVSFESMSISSVESIEISRTTSADMDADAPAGTINMKTRRAFDRKGRRIGFNAAVTINSEEFTLSRTYGPDDGRHYKYRPAFGLDYSDVFLQQRLGVMVNLSRANSYSEQYRLTHTYNRTPTATDPRPMVLTAIDFKDGPQFITKDTATLTLDFKAAPGLVLSLGGILNFSERDTANRNLTFTAAANSTAAATGRQNVLGTLTDFRTNGLATNTSRTVGFSGSTSIKLTDTVTFGPKFEYKAGAFIVDGNAAYSRSKNTYMALHRGTVGGTPVNAIVGDWRAVRPSPDSGEWIINQVSGPDWFDLANFKNPRISDGARLNITEIYSGALNATWKVPFSQLPTSLKFGSKWSEEARKLSNQDAYYAWSYVGPGGGSSGSWGAYPSPHVFDSGTTNALTVFNIANQRGMVPYPNREAIADLYREHPEYFVNSATADSYYNAFIANTRNVKQTVTSTYAMADVRPGSRLQIRAGLRWENTLSQSRETDPLPAAQVIAAGFPVNAARRASTIPGVIYQYFSRPLITRRAEYDDFFPSVSAKYSLGRNLQAQVGFNRAISRPSLDAISGTWAINDVSYIVTAPNPNLQPEFSKNYVARLAYYFEPVGSLTFTLTQNDVTNLRETHDHTAEEFGYGDDPQFAGYDFRTQTNSAEHRRFRGMEFGYSQTLSFLPRPLRGTTVNVAYTRGYANQRRPGLSPHRASGSIAYGYERFTARVSAVWSADTPFGSNYGTYRRHEIKYDLNVGWRLTGRYALFAQGRNFLNGSNLNFLSPVVEGEGGALQRLESHGVTWVFGVKGTL